MTPLNSFNAAANILHNRIAAKHRTVLRPSVAAALSELKKLMEAAPDNALQAYNDYVEGLISLHEKCSDTIQWEAVLQCPQPVLPDRPRLNEELAEQKVANFKASVLDKMLGQGKRKCEELRQMVSIARQTDDRIYNTMLKEFRKKTEEWELIQSITRGVLNRDPLAYDKAIKFFDPLSSLNLCALQTSWNFYQGSLIISLNYDYTGVLPDFAPVDVQNGKIVYKPLSDLSFHTLVQDHLFSSVLRISREVFALLPLSCILMHIYEHKLYPCPGAQAGEAILSVQFNAEGLRMLHYEALDCAEALLNFPHRINFSRETGFEAIQVLSGEHLVTG